MKRMCSRRWRGGEEEGVVYATRNPLSLIDGFAIHGPGLKRGGESEVWLDSGADYSP